jgi:hypothetical protein
MGVTECNLELPRSCLDEVLNGFGSEFCVQFEIVSDLSRVGSLRSFFVSPAVCVCNLSDVNSV